MSRKSERRNMALVRLQFYLDRAWHLERSGGLDPSDDEYGLFYKLAEALSEGGPGIDRVLRQRLNAFFEEYSRQGVLSDEGVSIDGRTLTRKRESISRQHLLEHLQWSVLYRAPDGAEGDASQKVAGAIYRLLTALEGDDQVRIARCRSRRCRKLFVYLFQGSPRKTCSPVCRVYKCLDRRASRKANVRRPGGRGTAARRTDEEERA